MNLFKSIVLLLSIVSIFSACSSDNELAEQQDCIDVFLERFDMNSHNGGGIPCGENYLVLFENESSTFAIVHNDCADLLPQLLMDCNGNELCTYVTDEGCFEMVIESENLGIIGIE